MKTLSEQIILDSLRVMDNKMQTTIEETLKENEVVFIDLESIKDDCLMKTFAGCEDMIFSYKGKDLIHFYPMGSKTTFDGIGYKITYERNYRLLT